MTSPERDATEATAPLAVHVVSHTHWDREWYHPMPRFRQRLVALIDALLEPDARAPFLLDGQGITLRDYLDVRPDRTAALSSALREGRLEAGPWFVLADNLIPSGEALVRNLEAGRRVLSRLGATPPPVAYCPDTFGHPAALPQLAAGFALPVAIVWRGAGGPGHPRADLFWWHGADGSRVLTYHLPPDGYEFGSALPTEPDAAAKQWARLARLFTTRRVTPVALLLNGADHHARQPDLEGALAALQTAAGDDARIDATTLSAWATRVQDAVVGRTLEAVHGELRSSYGYTWTLGGTLATRAHQKRANARLERGLLRDVEPWLALVRLHDRHGVHERVADSARLTMAQLPTLLDTAWETLLSTHPHDTLCGCSVDAVARAMDAAQESVAAQGAGLREAALQLALGHDPVAARSRLVGGGPGPIVLRNRAARPRGGLAMLRVHETIVDVPVGPASAGQRPTVPRYDGHVPVLGGWVVQSVAPPRLSWARRESPQHYPDNDLVGEHRLLAWVPEVPAFGVAAFDATHMLPCTPPPPVRARLEGPLVELENGRVHLAVTADGHVAMHVGDRLLTDALVLEDAPDVGDTYTPSPGPATRLRVRRVRLRENGPLRASVELSWSAASWDGHGTIGGPLHVRTTLSLTAGSDLVRCDVRGWNGRINHRLRLVWHTDVGSGETPMGVLADAAFGPVERTPIVAPPDSRERVPDGMPLHRWVMQADASVGATMLSDGLAEAHVGDGTMAVTLVRAVGELSRMSLPERPGHAGWPAPVPDAQCQGAFAARLGLLLHGSRSDAVVAQVRAASDELLLPLVGETMRDLELGTAPRRCDGPMLEGDAFEASAVTVTGTDDQAIVLRAVNVTDRAAEGAWRLPAVGTFRATPCRLDGTPIGEAFACDGRLPFTAPARGLVTFRLQRPATTP